MFAIELHKLMLLLVLCCRRHHRRRRCHRFFAALEKISLITREFQDII
jgi:hypothetical protein